MTSHRPIELGDEERRGIEEAERLVKEAEFGARELAGWSFWFSGALALTLTGFQLWTAAFGALPGVLQRSVHLTFTLSLAFLFYPMMTSARQRRPPGGGPAPPPRRGGGRPR